MTLVTVSRQLGSGGDAIAAEVDRRMVERHGDPLNDGTIEEEALAEAGRPLAGAWVLVLGYAYLENSDDTRNSPSAVLVEQLRERGAEVVIHDPYVPGYQGDVYALAQGNVVIGGAGASISPRRN